MRSNQITHQASLRKAAESAITKDLESTVKHRFFTYRCKQGPCKASIEETDKSLMYYDRDDTEDKEDFVSHCNARDLARDLLDDENNISTISYGETTIYDSNNDQENTPLARRDIVINRTISLDDSNNNQAIVEYEAEKDNKVIATIKTALVPNAVHWCSSSES